MPDHVLLLRAVNLVRRNRIAMADLRALLTGLGHTDVVTLLASGNALFRSPRRDRDALAREIEAALVGQLGLDVTAFVVGPADLRRIVRDNPLPEAVADDPRRVAVAFLAHDPDPGLVEAIDHAAFAPERVVVGPKVVYVWFADRMQESRIPPGIWERLGARATARGWQTVVRLDRLAKDRAAALKRPR